MNENKKRELKNKTPLADDELSEVVGGRSGPVTLEMLLDSDFWATTLEERFIGRKRRGMLKTLELRPEDQTSNFGVTKL